MLRVLILMSRHPDDHDLPLDAVMAMFPDLNCFGNYDKEWFQDVDGQVDEAAFNASRERLRQDTDTFEIIKAWIRSVFTRRTKHVNKNADTSYTLKHIAERVFENTSISNGTFIAAMIACGFKSDSQPNPHFNITQRSASKYSLLKMATNSERWDPLPSCVRSCKS